jgi:hypothetical protein
MLRLVSGKRLTNSQRSSLWGTRASEQTGGRRWCELMGASRQGSSWSLWGGIIGWRGPWLHSHASRTHERAGCTNRANGKPARASNQASDGGANRWVFRGKVAHVDCDVASSAAMHFGRFGTHRDHTSAQVAQIDAMGDEVECGGSALVQIDGSFEARQRMRIVPRLH